MVSAACLVIAWPLATASAQSQLRERIAGAVEMVESACASDVNNFCGNVTRGEGRVLLCMQAYEDQLSRRCQFALYRASRQLERAINRVERIADAWATEHYRTYAELARHLRLTEREVKLAIDAHRQREKRARTAD